jgi:cell division protein ZapA
MSDATYTKVTILGDEYRVAGEPTGASIPELASYVADKMSEVRESSATIDGKRVAVLTALNLADELLRERARATDLATWLQQRVAELGSTLDASVREEVAPSSLLD